MNTLQPNIAQIDSLKQTIKSANTDLRKGVNLPSKGASEETAKVQVKNTNNDSAPKSAENDPLKEKVKLEISEYLKMVSRLENKLKQGSIEDEELTEIISALEKQILSFSDQKKDRFKNLPFMKSYGVQNLKDMKDVLTDMFMKPAERDTLFEFLKSPEFMALLLNNSNPHVYSPPVGAAAGSSSQPQPGVQGRPSHPPGIS